MRAFVLDASVAAKWFLPAANETLKSEALALLGQYVEGEARFIVPELFWPEIGNILWKSARVGRISLETARAAIRALEERNFPTASCSSLLADAFAIAAAFDRSVYDATYVALAAASKVPFVTADERLVNSLAARFPVKWLGNI